MAVQMGKGQLKTYLCNVIDHMEEDSERYRRFSKLFLTATGVIDAEGNLTEEYRCSPYWVGGDDGTPLRASVQAELMGKLSPDVRAAIIEMESGRNGGADA
ncbi:hypothetical protein [Eggerthella timonensis]|uniref:hypothetical protein n=1 Tax=Eggerthella timonensis TaxID=1871008 RepID=UPI000C77CA79|nr:hypothetical protein [Eggerthella timonensis]